MQTLAGHQMEVGEGGMGIGLTWQFAFSILAVVLDRREGVGDSHGCDRWVVNAAEGVTGARGDGSQYICGRMGRDGEGCGSRPEPSRSVWSVIMQLQHSVSFPPQLPQHPALPVDDQ